MTQPAALRRRRDLFDALLTLGAGLDLAPALHRVLQIARETTGARHAVFAPTGAGRALLTRPVREDADGAAADPVLAALLRDPAPLTGFTQPIRVADLRRHPHAGGLSPDLPDGIALLATPVLAGGTAFGELLLFGAPGTTFTDEHDDVAVTITAATGVILATATLRDEARRRQRWLDASAEIVSTMLAAEHPDAVLDLLVRLALLAADADLTVVVTHRLETDELVVETAAGDPALIGRGVPARGTPLESVLRTGAARMADAGGARLHGWAPAGTTPGTGTADGPFLLVPFSSGGEVLGALGIVRHAGRPSFAAGELEAAASFADHAALAIELHQAHRDQQRLAVLADRDRIAHDLHDLVIQRLFAAGLTLEGVARAVAEPELAARIGETVDELDRAVADLRRSIFSLRSPLGPDGLQNALLAVCRSVTPELGHAPTLWFDGPLDTAVPAEVGEHATAVLAEALDNVARHAGAEMCEVQVRTDGRTLLVQVEDDGAGCDPQAVRGTGLTNLAARAEVLGGALQVTNRPRGGTTLVWQVPLTGRAQPF